MTNLITKFNFIQVEQVQEKEVEADYSQNKVDYAYLKGLCDSKNFLYTPRQYQLESLGYALRKGNLINGDPVGSGKSFEAIIYAEATNSFPCLVVTPASIKYDWAEVWRDITRGKRETAVIESMPLKKSPNNWDADVVVINYDIIGKKQGTGTTVRFQELMDIPWKMNIYDEGHFLKNKTAQRSKAAKKISKRDCKIQLLTGTATTSKPIEIWNLLEIAKIEDKVAKDWHQFINKYCAGGRGKYGWISDGATNILELNRVLRDAGYIRREKKEILPELPEVVAKVIKIPITNKKAIDFAKTDFIEYVRKTKGEESAEKAMGAEHLVALSTMRQLAIDGKLKGIEQYLKDWKTADNGKLLVFGIHKEALQYLSKKFKSKLISGGISSKKKQELKNEWIENDDTFLFANMDSAGTGLDGFQDVCSNMLLIELPWDPNKVEQVIGRISRSGQKYSTNVTFGLNYDTIDREMWEMLELKEEVTEGVNKGISVRISGSFMKDVINRLMENSGI